MCKWKEKKKIMILLLYIYKGVNRSEAFVWFYFRYNVGLDPSIWNDAIKFYLPWRFLLPSLAGFS